MEVQKKKRGDEGGHMKLRCMRKNKNTDQIYAGFNPMMQARREGDTHADKRVATDRERQDLLTIL